MGLTSQDDVVGAVEGDDPFAPHLRFMLRHRRRLATTFADRPHIGLHDLIGGSVEEALDFEALEAIASWQGLFQEPRDKRPGELDPEVESHMKACMPQFHLRNIGRAERLADPDDDLEFTHDQVEYGLRAPGASRELLAPYQAPSLLEETNLDVVRASQARRRWLIYDMSWPRHFCQELKVSIRGPLWRYDPDTASDEST